MNQAYTDLLEQFNDIYQLGIVAELLHWDQEVMMPKGSAEQRAEQTASLHKVIHQKTVSQQVKELLGQLEETQEKLGPLEQANLREAARTYKRAAQVPEKLVAALAKHEVLATEAWLAARKEKDYKLFQPSFETMLQLKRELADHIRGERSRYDALLDEYEPDETSANVSAQFAALRPHLVELLDKIKGSDKPTNPDALKGDFPAQKQKAYCRKIIEEMGFSFQEGRLDVSTHPFCSGGGSDVRITTRYTTDSIDGALFGCMHETGHGLYEQGLDKKRLGTPAGTFASLGLHESQSRYWENVIGRSYAFWEHYYPSLQETFPAPFQSLPLDEYWRHINHVTPSFIRTESDEVTYNLHIILRFELELELIDGKIETKDLPEVWNDRFERDFGIRPADDTEGCLQDIHWAAGLFGYFPTYSIGNLYSGQLAETIREALPVDELLRKGELLPIREWLREHVHAPGRTQLARNLITSVTGKAPTEAPFVAYLNEKYSRIYGL